MAQAGFTPISLFHSTTAAAVPTSGNLVAGELALNTVDEKLYFKNSGGTVKLLASNATSAPVLSFSAGTTGLTPNTATTGAVTLAGTLAVANGGTNASTASITSFNNITGFTATGATGTTSTNLVFSTSPVLTTPTLGVATATSLQGIIGNVTPAAGSFTTVGASSTLGVTGVATFSAGTAALPALTTTGDTNTGIFFPAADTICFSEGGLEAMRIDSAGNVGIGITPSAWFSSYRALVLGYANNGMFSGGDVQLGLTQNAFLDSGVSWRYTTSNPASQYIQINSAHQWFTAPSGTAGNAISFTQAMTLDASGNLGIGTTSPFTRLHVSGNHDASSSAPTYPTSDKGLVISTSSNGGYGVGTTHGIVFSANNVFPTAAILANNTAVSSFVSADLVFYTNPNAAAVSERLRITSAGNVGIGMSSPAARLQVTSNVSGSYGAIIYNTHATGQGLTVRGGSTSSQDAFNVQTYDGNTSLLTVQAGGNVGIGTSAPAAVTGFSSSRVVTQVTSSNGYAQLRLGGASGTMIDHDNGSTTATTIRNLYGATSNDAAMLLESGYIAFRTGTSYTERARIDSSGNLLIGCTTGSNNKLRIQDDAGTQIRLQTATNTNRNLTLGYSNANDFGHIACEEQGVNQKDLFYTALNHKFGRNTSTANMTLDSSGNLLVGVTSINPADGNVAGSQLSNLGSLQASASSATPAIFNRKTDDGNLVGLLQDGTVEGTISVSGTTVSYNGGNLSRWAQMLTKPELFKGTVMSNLDEMNVYTKDGQPVANEQLNKVKVSDLEGDANVAGVFVNWTHDDAHNVDEINMAMTGDMIIRIAQGTTVVRGDLLMSAGDGTAKPQGDDIVRSKTVAKVTSNHVTCTYADGSYCVPCVLMAC